MMVVMGCNSGGVSEGSQAKATKAGGSVIDLKVVGEKIKSAVEFAGKVKEVHTLVKSIDDIAKGIKKKIGANGLKDDANGANHHTPLLAGVFSVATTIEKKLGELQVTESLKGFLKGLDEKVKDVDTKAKAFTSKLKNQHATLGAADGAATDVNAKNAIDKNDATGGKGKEELVALNTAIDTLLIDSKAILNVVIAELTTKAVVTTGQSS
ncbi:Vsp/OspC family lipoprotein [Borrelia hispanica]|uniref:Vsp/OspC family lipoprotein n=1 Tax=Borrelia hispanica TaxID=40835 RepID=UPI001F2DC5D2|nr:Vsp/OspC family lipoprotein [Borrelia hispanica]